MARARFIRPEFFIDDKVGNLSMEARLLFQSLWCQSDLRGVFEWNLRQIRVQTFPHDEPITVSVLEKLLEELTSCRMVIHFESDGKRYGFVRKFEQYQSCTTSEKKHGSPRPLPPKDKVKPRSDSGHNQVIPPAPTPSSAPAPTPAPAASLALEISRHLASPPMGGGEQGRGKEVLEIPERTEAEKLAIREQLRMTEERARASSQLRVVQ